MYHLQGCTQIHPFTETVFPDSSGLFQQDYVPCPNAKIVKELYEKEGKMLASKLPPNSLNFGMCWTNKCWTIKCEPWQLTGQESAANVFARTSYEVFALILAAQEGPTQY